MMKFIRELQRRNVIRVAAAYLVVGWIVMQIVDVVGGAASLPDWVDAFALVILIVAFPVIVFIAWAFELTPAGMKRTEDIPEAESLTSRTGAALNIAIIVGLAIVVALLVWQQFAPSTPREAGPAPAVIAETDDAEAPDLATTGTDAQPPQRSVAVLPFLALSAEENDRYFADGLTEEILNSLAYLPDLIVTSRTSSFQFRGDDLPSVPEIAQRLGVAHILEGSVRPSGNQVRVTAQLIRASDDAHLWSQTYDRSLDDVFAIQEDIAENIAEVLGVALDEAARARMSNAGTDSIEAFILYQRGYEIHARQHGDSADDESEGLQPAQDIFLQAAAIDPGFADAFYLASDLFAHQLISISEADEPDLEQFEEIRQQYFAMLQSAADASDDPAFRNMLAIDRTYFSDDWIGTGLLLDRLESRDGCLPAAWLPEFSILSGRASDIAVFLETGIRCDPLNSIRWRSAYTAERAAENHERALTIAQRLSELPDPGLAFNLIAESYQALGQVDELQALLQAGGADQTLLALTRGLRDAESGDTAVLEGMLAAFLESGVTEDDIRASRNFGAVTALAAMGRRDLANAIASNVDALPLGYLPLSQVILACLCGAPWDLESTPDLARRLEQANFPWPPPGAGRFPANDAHNQGL